MTFKLPELPFAMDALVPFMSKETLEYHYGKHHNAYVTKLNQLTEGSPKANMTLEQLIKTEEGAIFNQAAQIWNHTFFWHSVAPKAGGPPKGKVAELITKSFGSFEQFKKDFTAAALGQFGSGWAWLVKDGDAMKIVTTSNAGCPLRDGKTPILTCDVWEHAYYVDYRNDRGKFVEAWFNLVNWEFANKNLG
ncbi:MAG: superoxide dismutase [Fe] [Deltaproteobacteria bacterium]|nr:superoxide dismutase [Fe] [Deltaproteobacteria bacterium]